MAAVLLPLLNVSIPFSLYTSFDYLGFWLYALFAVLMMKPLYGSDWSSKLIAILVGLVRNRVPWSICLSSARCHSGSRHRDQFWPLVHSFVATRIDSAGHILA